MKPRVHAAKAMLFSAMLFGVLGVAFSTAAHGGPGLPCETSGPACEGACGPGETCTSDGTPLGCHCAPGFPPAGTDLSTSVGIFRVDVPGVGVRDVEVSGQLLLQWQDPQIHPGTGERMVATELVGMSLHGADPLIGTLNVRAGIQQGLPPTFGQVTPLGPGSDFPALATFNVLFEVTAAGQTLHNNQPLVMQAVINEIPPRNVALRNAAPVEIVSQSPSQPPATVDIAAHWMCPPPFQPGVPCPVPCSASPFPVCDVADCSVGQQCVPNTAFGVCECVPGFPPAGTDLSPTTGIFHVDVAGVGGVDTSVAGETLLQWQNPQVNPGTGERTVQTELLSMSLTGSHPSIGSMTVRAGSQQGLQPSLGSVTPIGPGSDFPALATFDVLFEVEIPGVTTLRNNVPLVMQAVITEIPPRNIGLRNAGAVLLRDLINTSQVNVLQIAQHWMCPPPFPPQGVPCPVPCAASPFPVCSPGDCPGSCSLSGNVCRSNADCPLVGETCVGVQQCVRDGLNRTCKCAPPFPAAGSDLSPTVGIFRVDVQGLGPSDASVSGDTLLQWQDPQVSPTGEKTVATELLSLTLSGSHPTLGNLQVRGGALQGLPASLGTVKPLEAGEDFPALATFDVFFEVDVQGVATLQNEEPLVMEADITEIPPRDIGLRNAGPVDATDLLNPQLVSTLQTAQHWMCPPPFPPAGPCPVPCEQSPFPVCEPGSCQTPGHQCVPSPAMGRCTCVGPFPPAGTDLSPTVGVFRVDIPGVGPVDTSVSGQTLLQWQNSGSGDEVPTEMLSLTLTGSHPLIGTLEVRAGTLEGLPPTLGSVVPLGPGSDFPALATFDVFFEVEVNGATTLHNDQPLVMQAEITEIPPRSIGLRNLAPVQVTDPQNPGQASTIQTAQHWMCPPPFPPRGVPCPVPCERNPYPVCSPGSCPPDRPLCVADASLQSCRCVRPFPPAGFDLSPTTGLVNVDVAGLGTSNVAVSGETLLQWQDPQQQMVQTEMLSLSLSGSSPSLGSIEVRAGTEHGLPATLGSVVPVSPGADFPALATFNVFFEVEVQGVTTLHNDQPLVMQAEITEIPPRNIGLQNAAPVQITGNPQQLGTIQSSFHWMCPPPFPPAGEPCPVPCEQSPLATCDLATCPPGLACMPSPVGCSCQSPPTASAGTVPDPLELSKEPGGAIKLEWAPSCLSSDTDYEVYDGELVSNPFSYTHASLFCSTGGTTSITFVPDASSRYYLIVPHNGSLEGSYGSHSDGTLRPPGTSICRPQSVAPCPGG